jgi:putative SOS response-associated peptidase YedK
MCGRYRLSRRAEILASYFYAEYESIDWEARYNIAPTQAVPVIRQDSRKPVRRASLMRWGLVPNWAKDNSVGGRMINARAETAAEKPPKMLLGSVVAAGTGVPFSLVMGKQAAGIVGGT